MFWMANKVFMAHSVFSLMGLGWSVFVAQIGLGILIALLWIGAFFLWLEWRNT